jgi:hypothetical protein
MKRKRLLLVFVCLAAVLLAGYVTLRLTAPEHRITQENILAIQIGMSEKQVEAILGVRAGDYYPVTPGGGSRLIGEFFGPHWLSRSNLAKKPGGKYWIGENAAVWVRFDESAHAVEIWNGVTWAVREESFLDKLRRWLGM